MTGIERLRQVAQEYFDCSRDHTTIDVMPYGVSVLLNEIADQIAREHAEDCFSMGERAAEDAEAIAWVREHGGLSHVKDICHDFRAVVERLGIEWSESELHGLMDALDKRLMPEGMEEMIARYPRYEDGTPALPGMDAVANSGSKSGEAFTIRKAWLENGSWHLSDHVADGHYWHWKHKDSVVKRPARMVADADGAEIRVGEHVWHVETGREYVVVEPSYGKTVVVRLAKYYDAEGEQYTPDQLTHRAPVLASDGRPLREGETVYHIANGVAYVVREVRKHSVVVEPKRGGRLADCSVDYLTHERPDSWKRLEDDATLAPVAYCHDRDLACACDPDPDAATYIEAMASDLVRRAKALEERGQ